MPRLYHRPPKYCLHKGTKQATVSFKGERIYLGPYGSPESHAKYQEVLEQWQAKRNELPEQSVDKPQQKTAKVTPAMLRQKRRQGSPLTVNELVLVYRRHTHEYYRKNGKVTREATIIDDAIRYLRKHHATTFLDEFGPVALDELRDGMITDLDWSRKHINKQVGRLVRMFNWAAGKELVDPSVPLSLKSLAGLKKGRCEAKESPGVKCVDDSVIEMTLPALPEIIADMVQLQRLTGVRGERLQVVEGKTPEITVKQARALMRSIDTSNVVGLRDRAVIGILIYTAARVGAVASLRRRDFYDLGNQFCLRFAEKGGKSREIPVRHDLRGFINDYIAAGAMEYSEKSSPLFRTTIRRTKKLTQNQMTAGDMARMMKRRLCKAGLPINVRSGS